MLPFFFFLDSVTDGFLFFRLLCFVEERSAACSSAGIYGGYFSFFLSSPWDFSAIHIPYLQGVFFCPPTSFYVFFLLAGGGAVDRWRRMAVVVR